MSTLTDEIKEFIVKGLACYDTPSQVAEAVNVNFGITVSRQRVHRYDPGCSQPPAQRWRDLHAATRHALLREMAEIGIAHKAVRLRMLDRLAHRCEKNGVALALACLEQAAKECGGIYENRKGALPQPSAPQLPAAAAEPFAPQLQAHPSEPPSALQPSEPPSAPQLAIPQRSAPELPTPLPSVAARQFSPQPSAPQISAPQPPTFEPATVFPSVPKGPPSAEAMERYIEIRRRWEEPARTGSAAPNQPVTGSSLISTVPPAS
jgi:hypothetical protein